MHVCMITTHYRQRSTERHQTSKRWCNHTGWTSK